MYLVDPGLAVIDLNDAFADAHRSGVLVEELTVASLVQTLATGIPGINRVKILVGGKERETLAGHADLSCVYDVSAVGQMVAELQKWVSSFWLLANPESRSCFDRAPTVLIIRMRFSVVTITVTDASPMAIVEAVQFAHGESVCPDQVHLLIDVLAKISYVQHPASVVQVRIDQISSEAFEHG